MKDTLAKIFHDQMGIEAEIKDIKKLHGDASYRTYYRTTLSNGSTYVIMQMPKGKSSASEEITNFKGQQTELPFINVARFLKSKSIPVPSAHHYDEKNRLMIIEDLGDDLMAGQVENANDKTKLEWYGKAVELLTFIQQKTKDADASTCVALQRSFDETLLNWEFDHFLEYGITARLNKKMDPADLSIFNKETRLISEKIKSLPYGFTHRDFQSRNLLIHKGRIYTIDFQDALLGPAVYDLVALLRDSYIRLSDELVDELLLHYTKLTKRSINTVRPEFDLITIQRKFKDAGRFVYIDRVKKNSNFLKFIPTSLEYVRSAFERLPEYKEFFETLKKYVPEF